MATASGAQNIHNSAVRAPTPTRVCPFITSATAASVVGLGVLVLLLIPRGGGEATPASSPGIQAARPDGTSSIPAAPSDDRNDESAPESDGPPGLVPGPAPEDAIAQPDDRITVIKTVTMKAVRGLNGDSFRVRDEDRKLYDVHLAGVLTPPSHVPNAQLADRILASMVLQRMIRIDCTEEGDDTTLIGWAYNGSIWINAEIIRKGYALYDPRELRSAQLAQAEKEALTARRGIWEDGDFTRPWDEQAAEDEPDGAGNAAADAAADQEAGHEAREVNPATEAFRETLEAAAGTPDAPLPEIDLSTPETAVASFAALIEVQAFDEARKLIDSQASGEARQFAAGEGDESKLAALAKAVTAATESPRVRGLPRLRKRVVFKTPDGEVYVDVRQNDESWLVISW